MQKVLQSLLADVPFRPFRIVTTAGHVYDIEVSELAVLTEAELFFCVPRSDRNVTLRLNQIVAVECDRPPV